MAFETKVYFEGHQIAVCIAAMESIVAKLYIDGKVVDTCESSTTRSGCLLRGVIDDSDRSGIVEVLRKWSFTTPVILVNGVAVNGRDGAY